MADRIHDEAGDQRAVGIGADDCFIHDFFGGQDHAFWQAKAASFCSPMMPQMWALPFGVCALDMDDGHIRVERRHNHHLRPE